MRADVLVNNQRLMAQAIGALADHLTGSTGYAFAPVAFANLPSPPVSGMIACVNDSTVNTWGAIIVGGGTETVVAFYNGVHWTVIGA